MASARAFRSEEERDVLAPRGRDVPGDTRAELRAQAPQGLSLLCVGGHLERLADQRERAAARRVAEGGPDLDVFAVGAHGAEHLVDEP